MHIFLCVCWMTEARAPYMLSTCRPCTLYDILHTPPSVTVTSWDHPPPLPVWISPFRLSLLSTLLQTLRKVGLCCIPGEEWKYKQMCIRLWVWLPAPQRTTNQRQDINFHWDECENEIDITHCFFFVIVDQNVSLIIYWVWRGERSGSSWGWGRV